MPLTARKALSLDFGLEQAFARLTQRERWMVAGLAVALLGAAVFLSFDWAERRREAYALAQAERLEARRQVRLGARGGIGALERAQLADLKTMSVEARTLSLARIIVERKLTAAAQAAAVTTPAIRVSETLSPGVAAPVLSAEVSAPYAPGALLNFLDAVAAEPEAAFVESVNVTAGAVTAGAPGQMRVVFLFPVDLAPTSR